ncbi:MAG: MBL fold metallo-hydrolase [Deltaproteobacteria bacterium]|nr:MBL fold metallo-hydrolase [Deltaproteobacteria bacterium]
MRDRDFAIGVMACDEGASVWILDIGGFTVLVDSWLGDPYFSGPRGFFTGHRVHAPVIPLEELPEIDAVLLTSFEQDHTHQPSLERISRRALVIGPPACAQLAKQVGFHRTVALEPGGRALMLEDSITLLALKGYARNTAYVLRDNFSRERLCMAPHGVHAGWFAANEKRVLGAEFALDQRGRYVDTLCIGIHTTLLRPPRVPPGLLGSAGTIVPDPEESAHIVSVLNPRRVVFGHFTREHEEGFAVRHLLQYPTGERDVEHARSVFAARCPQVFITGAPPPGKFA